MKPCFIVTVIVSLFAAATCYSLHRKAGTSTRSSGRVLSLQMNECGAPQSMNSIIYKRALGTARAIGLGSAAAIIGSSIRASPAFAVKQPDFIAVRNAIDKVYKVDANRGPTLVRLAWHSSGTYDKMSKTGGSGLGTIRFKEELAHGANAGLSTACGWLEPIHQQFQGDGLSYADLYTLAGVEAIKLMQGPDIPWRAGVYECV